MNLRGVGLSLAGLVLATGSLAACGDDGDGEASPDASSSESSTDGSEGASEASDEGSPGARNIPAAEIPRTYDAALDHFDALGGEPVSWRKFVMPSGNIFCTVKVRGMPPACEINEGGAKDEVCQGTPTDTVGRVQFEGGRAVPVCNTDTIRTPGARTLPYGQAVRFRNFKIQCLSETIGVTCINLKATEGFFLHRGEYVIFNAG